MSRPQISRTLLRTAMLVVAAFCFWQALAPMLRRAAVASPGATSASAMPDEQKLITKPIQDIRPGMRVLAGNPAMIGRAVPDSLINPDSWRLYRMRMEKPDGSTLDVELLRPIEWAVSQSMQRALEIEDETFTLTSVLEAQKNQLVLANLLIGRELILDMPELGAAGPARVNEVCSCPAIEASKGTGFRVVTGTFHHSSANIVALQVKGEEQPIEATSNHPFWSEDRKDFVEAGHLKLGEMLLLAGGRHTQVIRKTSHAGPPVPVYNLEVDTDHTYHVGEHGVLVHNAYPLPILRAATHGGPLHNSIMVRTALGLLRRTGITNVRTNQALSNGSRTLSKLRPDVQYIEDGLVHIVEVNHSGGPGYHALREADFRAILGPLFGSYTGL